jgi:hypothetical protein
MKWNYDYSQTLWMKIFLAEPDFEHNRSKVYINFEQTLEIVKTVDKMTQGIKKILYLVGWQGLGHDDCYPEMEVYNEFLKRDCDETAKESLYWLFNEAKKYNTVISFHGNLADTYSQTPCFPDLVAANAVAKNKDGTPGVIEHFNNRDAYKISYKGYYESGLFKKYWDRFCEATPVREAGTVHLDNFCIAQSLNPYTSVEDEDEARNKMLDYIASLGIDVTSEYTYRELEWRADSPEHPIREFYAQTGIKLPESTFKEAPIRCLGRIPAVWWMSGMTPDDCLRISPKEFSGHMYGRELAAYYGSMHGEDIWRERGTDPKDWADEFIYQFCTLQLPYFYLNRLDRLNATVEEDTITAYFSDKVVSYGKEGRITKNGIDIKNGDDVLLPLDEECTTFIAYSKAGKNGEWAIPDAKFADAKLYEITPDGNVPLGDAKITDGKITLDVKPGKAIVIKNEKR